jgi:indolepyruvate ferredoxin oxidoreductase, beta subunit
MRMLCAGLPQAGHRGGPMRCNVLLVGVGGQGVLLAARVIGECALRQGHQVVMSEVHGMAQRGGSVSAIVRFGDEVLSPLIPLGGADVIIAFEPVEMYRALPFAHACTKIISDTSCVIPMSVTSGGGEYPATDDLIGAARNAGLSVLAFDATSLAKQAGSSMSGNSVLLGAAAEAGVLPLSKESLLATLIDTVPIRHREMNTKAFEMGAEAAKKGR